jgi:hypothetical protein
VAHLLFGPIRELLRRRSGLAWVGFVGHTQKGAQHIDAGLPVRFPVIGQACHGMHASQPDCWLLVAELRGDRDEPLVEDPGPVMSRVGFGDLLSPIGDDQGD